MSDLKEFIDDTEALARAKAARHLNVSEDELDAKLVPAHLEIANLAGRVIVLAAVRRAAAVLGPVGEFVQGILQRMGIEKISGLSEQNSDGQITVTVDSPGLAAFARDHKDLLAALGHLAERAAQKEHGSDTRARVELAGRGPDRGRGRGDRGRDGRGPERDDGRRERGERGGRRERGDRGGRGGGAREGGGRDRDRSRGRRDASDSRDGGPENPELEQRARDTGRRVVETGEAATLDEMSSRDRWVVHNALKEVDGVGSESVGEGRMKRVKIYPA